MIKSTPVSIMMLSLEVKQAISEKDILVLRGASKARHGQEAVGMLPTGLRFQDGDDDRCYRY